MTVVYVPIGCGSGICGTIAARDALHLAEIGHLDEYLDIYEQFYQGLDAATLDCLALQAELDAGRTARVVHRAGQHERVSASGQFDHPARHRLAAARACGDPACAVEAAEEGLAEVRAVVAEIGAGDAPYPHDVLFSTTEYKKTSMKYFVD